MVNPPQRATQSLETLAHFPCRLIDKKKARSGKIQPGPHRHRSLAAAANLSVSRPLD